MTYKYNDTVTLIDDKTVTFPRAPLEIEKGVFGVAYIVDDVDNVGGDTSFILVLTQPNGSTHLPKMIKFELKDKGNTVKERWEMTDKSETPKLE